MTSLSRLPLAIVLGSLLALCACGPKGEPSGSTGAATPNKTAEPGQVIARVNGEEITVHQLNTELATVRSTGQDAKELQQQVLRAIVLRTMLRQAAVKEKIDRDPQVSLLIQGAKDKVLADAYITSQTGSTPPPTSSEIEKYVSDNPLQFGDRRIYQFDRLTLPVDQYSELLVPMFDEKPSFDEFKTYLNGKAIAFTLAEVRLPSTDFPKQVQDQLIKFGTGDNIVVRGPQSIVILKIKGWVDMPAEQQDAQRAAENVLHQQALQERALALRGQMEHSANVTFLGQFAGMSLEEPKAAEAPAESAPPMPSAPPGAPATPLDANPPSTPGDGIASPGPSGQKGQDQ